VNAAKIGPENYVLICSHANCKWTARSYSLEACEAAMREHFEESHKDECQHYEHYVTAEDRYICPSKKRG